VVTPQNQRKDKKTRRRRGGRALTLILITLIRS